MKHKNKEKHNRCIISNKILDGHESVLKEYAYIYVMKQGQMNNEEFEQEQGIKTE